MDIGIAFRGTEYAPTFALSPEVIERAAASAGSSGESLILCLSGRESARRIAELLAEDPRVLFVEPAGGLQAPARRTIAAFRRLVFAHGTPAVVLIAALIAVNRDYALRIELETSRSRPLSYYDDAVSD